jgi:hypothetical protein
MRMRKLGQEQSVIFCAPPEIDDQIRKAAQLTSDDRVDALDVLRWAMLETCHDLEHHISHWAQQGVEHNRRAEALQEYASTPNVEALKRGWMTPEARSLEDMYGISSSTSGSGAFTAVAFAIPSLRKRFEDLGIERLEHQDMGEEQEREVSHEVERERHIERPPKSQPATHAVHEDIRAFVRTGLVPSYSNSIVSLFHPLRSFGSQPLDVWSPKLRASLDFCATLATSDVTTISDYMRPLNWILSGPDGTLVALSPYEANALLPSIRSSQLVRLHVFAPRVIQSMISFSDLRFYSVPSLLSSSSPDIPLQLQLSLFAGQLYLNELSEYQLMCAFLGVYMGNDKSFGGAEIQVQTDGFLTAVERQKVGSRYLSCGFSSSPVSMLKDLVGRRRKGMEYLRTHVGQILHARQLSENDFLATKVSRLCDIVIFYSDKCVTQAVLE